MLKHKIIGKFFKNDEGHCYRIIFFDNQNIALAEHIEDGVVDFFISPILTNNTIKSIYTYSFGVSKAEFFQKIDHIIKSSSTKIQENDKITEELRDSFRQIPSMLLQIVVNAYMCSKEELEN